MKPVRVLLLVLPLALFLSVYSVWQSVTSKAEMEKLVRQITTLHPELANGRVLEASKHPLVLQGPASTIEIPSSVLTSWIEPYFRPYTGLTEYRVKHDQVLAYLFQLAPRINTPGVDARFTFENNAIRELIPGQTSKTLDQKTSLANILQALSQNLGTAQLAVTTTPPTLNLAKLETLGITTRLSEGTSNFTGSPTSRIHNIRVGARRFDMLIVQPGEEFSFNAHLGEVTASTGYRPELVIKGTKLIPEYGGGICQVSTTLFRAAMEAGLKIVERKAHSLPVRYYNPQGYDATIYPGVVDLRFQNDTPAALFVQSRVEGAKIFFEIYGASDGRSTLIEGPVQFGATASGSLKAVVTQVVTRADGTEEKKSFYSNYKAPALFQTIRNPLE